MHLQMVALDDDASDENTGDTLKPIIGTRSSRFSVVKSGLKPSEVVRS
jgi:hypothetical protein